MPVQFVCLHPRCLPAAADDCAIKSKLLVGRRGIAGTVLVHKVAGAAAAAGGSLEEVKAAAEEACASIGTIGASLTECTLFGHAPNNRQVHWLRLPRLSGHNAVLL
jgi:dihydroxyacetone kinase